MTAKSCFAIFALLAVMVFINFIIRQHMKSKQSEAYVYLAREADTYWRSKLLLTQATAQKIFRKLFDINAKVLQSDEFWSQPYVRMLELIIASCANPEFGLVLIYGTIKEKTPGHAGRQPRKQVWMEFVFENIPYMIKIDANNPSTLCVANCRYMYSHGFVKQACLHDGKIVRQAYEQYAKTTPPADYPAPTKI